MKWNIPNMLTVSRLFLALILIALIGMPFPMTKTAALLVFILAGITDFLDGHLARNVYGVTAFGRLMDPLTDKVLVCSALVSFVGIRLPGWNHPLLPVWIVVVIISREFLVTGLRLLASSMGHIISAGRWGKHKTVWQIVAISVILLGLAVRYDILNTVATESLLKFDFAFGLIAYAIGLAVTMITVASGAMYFAEHTELLRHKVQ
ncbi:MAG: CDP-diacylglycerol--glycerol-3-phosphate 3-phosphatidyltransferase [Kiritimatiellia bacterium]